MICWIWFVLNLVGFIPWTVILQLSHAEEKLIWVCIQFPKKGRCRTARSPRHTPLLRLKTLSIACDRAIYCRRASIAPILPDLLGRGSSEPGCTLTALMIEIKIPSRKQTSNSKAPATNAVVGMEAETMPWPGTEGWLSWRPDSAIALHARWRAQLRGWCYLMRARSRWAVWLIKGLGIMFPK